MFNIALINVNLIVIKDNKIIFMKIPKTIKIKKCRLCKNNKLKQIYNFGNHYVSNFVSKASIYKGVKAPLNLVYCKKCHLLQLEHSAPQEIMYKKFLLLVK